MPVYEEKTMNKAESHARYAFSMSVQTTVTLELRYAERDKTWRLSKKVQMKQTRLKPSQDQAMADLSVDFQQQFTDHKVHKEEWEAVSNYKEEKTQCGLA